MKSPHGHRSAEQDSDHFSKLQLPLIECGSFEVFSDLIYAPTTVLLMPIHRRITVMDGLDTHVGVQVTALSTAAGSACHCAILTTTFIAAACTTCGGRGWLLLPQEDRSCPSTASLLQYVQSLQEELLTCLEAVFSEHPKVLCVRQPARYRIPDAWAWRPASLANSGIRFEAGHWISQPPQKNDDSGT